MPKTVPPKKPAAPAKTSAEIKAEAKAKVIRNRESARQKKANQRASKRSSGLVQVSVWVSPDQVYALREFASSLPVTRRETVPQGPTLFDGLE